MFFFRRNAQYQIGNIIFAKETRGDPRVHQWFGAQLQQRTGRQDATLPDLTPLDLKHTRKQAVLNMVEQEHHGDQRNKTAEDAHLRRGHRRAQRAHVIPPNRNSAEKVEHRDKICRIQEKKKNPRERRDV